MRWTVQTPAPGALHLLSRSGAGGDRRARQPIRGFAPGAPLRAASASRRYDPPLEPDHALKVAGKVSIRVTYQIRTKTIAISKVHIS
jgi:hypothetical protein